MQSYRRTPISSGIHWTPAFAGVTTLYAIDFLLY